MVIRMRHTRSHTKNRRSHHALKEPTLSNCSNCEAKHRPHHMCLECGFYKGKLVMDVKAKKEAREARMKAKRDAIKAERDSYQDSGVSQPEAETPTEAKESTPAVEETNENKSDK